MILAAIQADPTKNPAPAEPDPLAGLRDTVQLVEVPTPEWVWWAIGAGAVLVLALLVWLVTRIIRNAPKPQPPSPRIIALRALEQLRPVAGTAVPYEFSIRVSDVLRTFASGHYHLRATQQTSPEFLASIAGTSRFTDADRALLAKFLERCDLLKFARVEAGAGENEALLQDAAAFVKGGAQ